MSLENHAAYCVATGKTSLHTANTPLLIGDAIHVLSQTVQRALVNRDERALVHIARKQQDAGADALAVNLGPGKEMGLLTPWVVETMRQSTELPLFFSAGIMDRKQVLEEHGRHITINAVTASREDLARGLRIAREYGSSLVVLLVQAERGASGVEGRIRLAGEVLEQAVLDGLPLSRLFLDPVLTCRPDPAAWQVSRGMPDVGSVAETISLLNELDSGVRTIAALGNASGGMAREKRSAFHSGMFSLFAEVGIDAVLLNCLDTTVMQAARNIQCSGSSYGRGSTVAGYQCQAL